MAHICSGVTETKRGTKVPTVSKYGMIHYCKGNYADF